MVVTDPSGIVFEGDGGLPRAREGEEGDEVGEELVFGDGVVVGLDLGPIGWSGEGRECGASRERRRRRRRSGRWRARLPTKSQPSAEGHEKGQNDERKNFSHESHEQWDEGGEFRHGFTGMRVQLQVVFY